MSSITDLARSRTVKHSLTIPKFCLAALTAMLALPLSTAHAMAGCPPMKDGRPLARLDGASLYQGDPANNMLLAPSHENVGGRGVNTWDLPNPAGIVLICKYEGAPTPIIMNLPLDVHVCQQSAGSFLCK